MTSRLSDFFLSHYDHQVVISALSETFAVSNLKSSTAYVLFYTALFAIAATGIIWSLATRKVDQRDPGEFVISARNSAKWWAIAASFFVSCQGSWVLAAPAEVGRVAGWLGVVGYALATAVPWAAMAFFGPMMRSRTNGRGFTATDYVKVRLGRTLQVVYTVFTLGLIFISFVVEATTISSIYLTVAPDIKTVVITVSLALITFAYTTFAGFRASLLTDRIQFLAITLFVIFGSVAIYGLALPQVSSDHFKEVGKATGEGLVTALVLILSCFYATFMDPSTWSRMYAAESEHAARVGLLVATAMLCVPLMIFGSVGIVAEAGVRGGAIQADLDTLSPFFAVLGLLKPVWSGGFLLLATCLSASSIDTFSSGFACVVAAEIGERRLNYNWARLVALVVFVAALITALFDPPSIMVLFMVANLGSACMAPPMLLSLWSIVTPIGVGVGVAAGYLTVCTFGWVRIGTFAGGFDWWLLPEGFYATSALVTFIVTGAVSTLLTLGVSQLQFFLDESARDRQVAKFTYLKEKHLIRISQEGDLDNSISNTVESMKAEVEETSL